MNQTVQTITESLAIGGSNSNVFSGQRLAELPASFGRRFKVTIVSACELQGVTETIYAGNRATPVHESEASVASAAGRLVTRDDVTVTFLAEAGEKIQVSVANTNAAANEYYCRLIVQPVS